MSNCEISAQVLSPDLNGRWQTASGAVYDWVQKDGKVSATYSVLSQNQAESGVKVGDIAFVGDIVGSVVAGVFHHRFPLSLIKDCPATYYQVTNLNIQISEDGSKMEGILLLTHRSDTCEIDDRRLSQLVFARMTSTGDVGAVTSVDAGERVKLFGEPAESWTSRG